MYEQSLLTLSVEQTCIAPEGGVQVQIAISLNQIVETAFRQAWQATAQLEAAINLIEDAIMDSGLCAMPRGSLVSDSQLLQQAFQVNSVPVCLDILEVEQRYRDIALSAYRQQPSQMLMHCLLPPSYWYANACTTWDIRNLCLEHYELRPT